MPCAVALTDVSATSDILSSLAKDAEDDVRTNFPALNNGPVFGTRVHSSFEKLVNSLGRSDLWTEVSYKDGFVVDRGTRGSVRLDVVEGPSLETPIAVYDLKTGGASLTPARISQIRKHLPDGYKNIPINEVRP